MSRWQECNPSQSCSVTNDVSSTSSSTTEQPPIIALLRREKEYLEVVSRCEHELPMPTLHTQWRTNIFEWFYKIIDHFVLHRAVVSVAMDYFDRFLLIQELHRIHATTNNTAPQSVYSNVATDLKIYQLAAMTSLYIAMKVHAGNEEGPATSPWKIKRKTFSLTGFVKLSRGTFTSQDILAMELEILKILEWKMNPVTPACFLDAFMALVPTTDEIMTLEASSGGSIHPKERYGKKIHFSLYIYYELARYLFELAMCIPGITPYFHTSYSGDKTNPFSSSAIAFASASLAMDMMSTSVLSPRVRVIFLHRCMDIQDHPYSKDLSCCRRISPNSDVNIHLKKIIHQNFIPEYVLGTLPGHDGKNPFTVACDMGMFTSIFSKTDVQPESPTSPIEEAAM